MVLTRSMTTNNNNRDEPRITAFERQVQTLAAVVECLTKQNHDLEEQLRQRDAIATTMFVVVKSVVVIVGDWD